MRMPMMDVRIVRMGVGHLAVVMNVRVGLTSGVARLVQMLMVLVVPVKMLVSDGFMMVRMGVALREMEPDANSH